MKKISLLFILYFFLLGNTAAEINSGLVAYYPFDGNANDSSGNGNHGIENGGISYTSGKKGQAANFDGLDDYIKVIDNPSLRLSNFSIALWVKLNGRNSVFSTTDHISILNKGGLGTDSRGSNTNYIIVSRGNGIEMGFEASDGTDNTTAVPIEKFTNDWQFLAFSYENSVVSMYLDGILIDTLSTNDEPEQNSLPLIFGKNATSGYYVNNFYRGLLDEVRIYNRALSESEIQELYKGKENCNIPEAIIANNTIMLGDNNHFTLQEKGNVFGANGNEIVKIAGTPNANIDSNIERIEFSKNLDFYTFILTGNILTVSNTYGVVAKITTSDRLLKLAFKDGSVNFNLTGLDNGVFSEGALTLSNNFDITDIKAILNTNDSSDSTLVNIGSIVSQCA